MPRAFAFTLDAHTTVYIAALKNESYVLLRLLFSHSRPPSFFFLFFSFLSRERRKNKTRREKETDDKYAAAGRRRRSWYIYIYILCKMEIWHISLFPGISPRRRRRRLFIAAILDADFIIYAAERALCSAVCARECLCFIGLCSTLSFVRVYISLSLRFYDNY